MYILFLIFNRTKSSERLVIIAYCQCRIIQLNNTLQIFQCFDWSNGVQFGNLSRYWGKTNFYIQRSFNANTILVAIFQIRFRSFFFNVEKRIEVTTIVGGFSLRLCSREMLLGHIENGISWWLTSNWTISLAIDDNLGRGNQRSQMFLVQRTQKIKTLVKLFVNCTHSHAISSINSELLNITQLA